MSIQKYHTKNKSATNAQINETHFVQTFFSLFVHSRQSGKGRITQSFGLIRALVATITPIISMKILGRSDRVDLPGLGLTGIHAKIDTGAYTCSLHCCWVKIENGILEFVLLDKEHTEFTGTKYYFKKFTQREIKNSFGEAEMRYIIKTTVTVHGKTIRAEFSLSDRDKLRFPVLLGRKILRNR